MPKALKASDTVIHHKDRHLAEKFERLLGVLMVIAIAGLDAMTLVVAPR